ncbi:hypothetical protein BpHYR1_040705, partial [Brachionus plicatilis]
DMNDMININHLIKLLTHISRTLSQLLTCEHIITSFNFSVNSNVVFVNLMSFFPDLQNRPLIDSNLFIKVVGSV